MAAGVRRAHNAADSNRVFDRGKPLSATTFFQSPGRRYSIRAHLGAIVIVSMALTLTLAGWLAFQSVVSEQTQIEQSAYHTAREITTAIEREIISAQNLQTALAISHFLQNGQLEQFHRQAVEVARQLNIQIVLRDAQTDRYLLNTAFPWGAPLPQVAPDPVRDVSEQSVSSGKPSVSGVIFDQLVKQYLVAVLLPVTHDGRITYFLCVGLPLDNFARLLDRLQLDDSWIATIVDRTGVIVARSKKHGEFAGKQVPVYPETPGADALGVSTGINIEGVPFHWFNSQSQLSGWRISVGVPDSALAIPLKRALLGYGGGSAVLLVAAIAFSYLLGSRLSQSFGALGIDRKPTREEFSALFEQAPNGVVVIDNDGLIALLNLQIESMFGYGRDELIGHPLEMLVPERFSSGHSKLRQGYLHSPATRPMGAGRDLFARRKDSSEFAIEIGLNPISTRAGNLVIATVVDITARKRSEQQLSAVLAEHDDLRRRLMQAQEQERLRLARELHDQTGQDLTAALLALKGLEPLVDSAGQNGLQRLRGLLDQIGKTLQRVARELRPTSIDDLELGAALANHISEWSEQFGIEADFHCGDGSLDNLGQEVRTTVYRLIQESLSNVAKHAGADSVSVVIDRAETLLRLTIEDNGCGFDTATAGKRAREQFRGGLGIAGMRERVALIGGEIEIESSIGSGTTIFAGIPFEPREATE